MISNIKTVPKIANNIQTYRIFPLQISSISLASTDSAGRVRKTKIHSVHFVKRSNCSFRLHPSTPAEEITPNMARH
jgi:hypothetical protein